MIALTTKPTSTKRHREIERWVRAGHSVLLLKPRGKSPLGSLHHHGFKDATSDLEVAREWLSSHPTANYGIVPPDGVLVIDVDPKAGGHERWNQLLADHEPLPATLRTLTSEVDGVRGEHIWFRAPSLPTGAGDLRVGVEYKCGSIGYLVGPGSKHPSGDLYEREGPIDEMAPAPGWLVNVIASENAKPLPASAGGGEWTVPIGQRYRQLLSLSGSLCNLGYSTPDEIEGALLVLADRFEDTDGALRSKMQRIAHEVAGKWGQSRDVASVEATQAQALIRIAQSHYEFGIDDAGGPFVLPVSGVRIAKPMSSPVVTSDLTLAFFEEKGSPPSPTAIRSALSLCEAQAHREARTSLSLRASRNGPKVALDLGRADGRCVVLRNGRWKMRSSPPSWAVFKRTALTGEMVTPKRSGSIDALRPFAPVDDESWDLLVAWLVAVMLVDVPVPILALTGEHGSGKSTLGRLLVSLLDPSPAPLRQPPTNRDDWIVAAAGSRVVGIDNLSRIPLWLSDSMCRAVTGEGHAQRALYTDDSLSVFTFRRALLLTSIDPGEIRGDLASRMLPIELRQPTATARRGERDMDARIRKALPKALGGLLDLAATVLANPVLLDEQPRMADFAQIAASVDEVRGSDALGAFMRAQDGLVDLVAESDPVALAIERLFGATEEWSGTPTELHTVLKGYQPTRTMSRWPATPRVLAQRLNRLAPTLRERGVAIERHDTRPKRITLTRGATP